MSGPVVISYAPLSEAECDEAMSHRDEWICPLCEWLAEEIDAADKEEGP